MSKLGNKSGFVARNSAASATGRSARDAWRQFLLTQGGKGDGSTSDLEKRWLRVKGGVGETLNALWSSYLDTKGFVGGGLTDRKRRFFESGTQT